MSVRVRSTLALCTATALVLLGSGAAAAADDATTTLRDVACDLVANPDSCDDVPDDGQPTDTAGDPTDELQEPAQDPAGTEEGPESTDPVTGGLAEAGLDGESLDAVEQETGTEETGTQETGAGGTGAGGTGAGGTGAEDEGDGEEAPGSPEDAPDIEGALECLAAVGEDFVTEFLAQLEAAEPELAEELAGTGSLEELVAALDGGDVPVTEEDLAAIGVAIDDAVAELVEGNEELQACRELLIPVGPPAGEDPPPAQPVTNPAPQQPQYADCDDARAEGAAPVHAGQPGYGPHLDSDSDGIGCEQETAAVSHTSPTAAPQLAYTGFDVWPFAGAGAAMLVLGSALVAGARRSA